MASAAYMAWLTAGKPLTPCQPIRDYVTRLRVAFPRAANLFSWYANDAHYMAVPPQDHTPYSATGWPQASPRWVVFATDVMHRPDLGVDCNVLFPYWLAEARAGRTPWVKYLIWQAKLYDVRNGWKPVANSGHFDHIHISVRTDHLNTSLGAWSLNGDDMPFDQHNWEALIWRVEALIYNRPNVAGGPSKGEVNQLGAKLAEIDAQIEALAVGAGLDPAALKAAVQEAIQAETAAIADAVADEQHDRLAD